VSVERRAEIWKAKSVEETKIVNLTYQKKKIKKIDWNIPRIFWNIPKIVKMTYFRGG